ncbi:class I SAM-dependent methyltransferase [Ancylobacter vacuolatus]|uniref:SAM-dependent methyltransferase n=1 Tax=Ancylobacter vacuolatus TaxID=223389 RepID=A0ABU0DL26_9HYPH|nr:class I SAM-dependent methyltransferase [Ancylobacter vacuolatus]MDQ0349018.1 SAM-dependent methyltransferase [Ancylobacter vacuolatus]
MKQFVKNLPIIGPLAQKAYIWAATRTPLSRRLIMDRTALHEFWQTRAPEGNVPEDYLRPVERSRALLALISDVPKTAKILEIGCNIGRNLAFLHDAGYRDVRGIEISRHAVGLLRENYPQLKHSDIRIGAAEDVLPTFGDGEFDLVFTMAVLEHIHPQSQLVFDNMARITSHILCIEPKRGHASSRQYPHDLKALFKARGFECTRQIPMWDVPELQRESGLEGYVAYRFERRGRGR